jgi:signal transduction histidine kinase
MNGVAEKLLRTEERLAFGRDLFSDQSDLRFVEKWSDYVSGDGEEMSVELRASGPSPAQVALMIARIRTPEGRSAGFVALLRDVSKDRSEQRIRREVFLSLVQDMRTSLASLRRTTQNLSVESLSPREAASIAASLRKDGDRLHSLLEDAQALGRAEADELNLRDESFSKMLRDVCQAASVPAVDRGIRVEMRIPEEDLLAEVDPDRLRKALDALFASALRHAPGSLVVDLKEDQRRLVCTMRVPGRGFSEELERSLHGSPHANGCAPSLGLYVARRTLELQGGDIATVREKGEIVLRFSIPAKPRTHAESPGLADRDPFADALIDDPDEEEAGLSRGPAFNER